MKKNKLFISLVIMIFIVSLNAQAITRLNARNMIIGVAGVIPNKAQLDAFVLGYDNTSDKRQFIINILVKSPNFFYGPCQLMFAHFFSEEGLDDALKQTSTINGDGNITLCKAIWDSPSIPFTDAFIAPFFYRAIPGTYGTTTVTAQAGQYKIDFIDTYTQQPRTEYCPFHNSANQNSANCFASHRVNPDVYQRVSQLGNTYENYIDDLVGILTTHSFAKEWYTDGTNRSALAYGVFERMLGKSMEDLFSVSAPDTFVRFDVDRSDSVAYTTSCVGCHSGMDSMLTAFAYYDFKNSMVVRDHRIEDPDNPGQLIFAESPVKPRLYDDTFLLEETAIPVTNNNWTYDQIWNVGKNANIFTGPASGTGLRSFMQSVTQSPEFNKQMVKVAYRGICGFKITEFPSKLMDKTVANFAVNKNMLNVIAEASMACHDKPAFNELYSN